MGKGIGIIRKVLKCVVVFRNNGFICLLEVEILWKEVVEDIFGALGGRWWELRRGVWFWYR